ncbi:MAG: phospholipase D-like domain-containing protein [Acidobacteriota bacterium]
MCAIRRFSSRRRRLADVFLTERLRGARGYDRIAGYFRSSLLEVAGELLESVQGPVRVVCNSDLREEDVQTARAAKAALRRHWTAAEPERLLEPPREEGARRRFGRLYEFLTSGKLKVRVLPDTHFGLIHGKAGVITLADGTKTAFLGSVNESLEAWRVNYELVWEDDSPEAVRWVQEEFDALWASPFAVDLADAVVTDIGRLARRTVLFDLGAWRSLEAEAAPDPAPVFVEAPVYRRENGLWPHQKYFVHLAFQDHVGPVGKARYLLADQVGLGKTLQLAMSALLMALVGEKPILILCPKTLVWQWQAEMRDLLDLPAAVWTSQGWVDENDVLHPDGTPDRVSRCPRRVGIVSTGLIFHKSAVCDELLKLEYECVILDEAHRARRRNVHRPEEPADRNNLLAFMEKLAERTRSLLLATATPVQLHPIEAWDLLGILARGDDSVLGNEFSRWRQKPLEAIELIMGRRQPPPGLAELWEWVRNPLPPKSEDKVFERLRNALSLADAEAVAHGHYLDHLGPPDRQRLESLRENFFQEHHPFIRRIVRRTRQQLEEERDPETGEPLLEPIGVRLFGEGEQEAILLPAYLHEAYELAEEFCRVLGERMKGSGFLRTLLLRRVGSSIYAGRMTAERMLSRWEELAAETEEEDDDIAVEEVSSLARSLTAGERELLERFLLALEAHQEEDPKYARVREYLLERRWLDRGCIIFSQYYESAEWLARLLSRDLPAEPIAVYAGHAKSGLFVGGTWTPKPREELKAAVAQRKIRLMLGTDAASEGLNLQRLGSLINLDLPWNPTRLEQRKGRIQRIGQVYPEVYICNLRYKDSVEDRVHELLSDRLQAIYDMFGQLPDFLEDAWVAAALGEMERAKQIIDEAPEKHPFELRYSAVEPIDWESCTRVLAASAKLEALRRGWGR